MRASSSGVSQFLTAINLLVVLVLTPFMASAQSYDVSFIHTDHLGSPVAVTSVTGEVIWNAQFSAYGKEYQGTGTPAQDPIGFAGSSNDRQTGLVYMQARFYDPDIGRFLSVDPVGFTTDNVMSFNRYLYVNNNPYAYIDPDGEFLKAITTAVKVGYKAIKARKNPIKAIGEELVGAVDDAMTIFDGQWTIADLAATADLLIGTDLNNKATRTARAVPDGPSVGDLRRAGDKDAHHIIQDAAVRDLPDYKTNAAPGIQLQGPANVRGTAHHLATQVQRQAGGGTYAAERRIGYKALRRAGLSEREARAAIQRADAYFKSIGATPDTVTRIPGNR